jgi:hypothetical protein
LRRAHVSAPLLGAALAPCALSLQDDLLSLVMSDLNRLECVAQSRRLIDERAKPPDMSAPATGDARSAGQRPQIRTRIRVGYERIG